MDYVWLGIGLVVGIILGYLFAIVRRARAGAGAASMAELAQARERAAAAEALVGQLRAEVAGWRDGATQQAGVLQALAPLQAKLHEVASQVVAMEQGRAQQHTLLSEQLRGAAQSEEALRRATESLAGALKHTTARGMWGEVELRRILEASGMMRHIDFAEQSALGAGRPDVVVTLPGGRFLAIDAKVPLDSYLAATSADVPEARRTELLNAHARALRGHVDALAKRGYWQALPASPELTVLFLPADSLLQAALDADPALLEYAFARGVAPAVPSSLLALLKTVATMWQEAEVTADARRLLDLGRTLYQRLATLTDHVTKLGSSLQATVGHYNRMVGSLEMRVLATARSFESFDAAGLRVEPLDGSLAARGLSAPEFTATGLAQPEQPVAFGESGGQVLPEAAQPAWPARSAPRGEHSGASEPEAGPQPSGPTLPARPTLPAGPTLPARPTLPVRPAQAPGTRLTSGSR